MRSDAVEYPDAAGYPDGMGFLDEGTAAGAGDSPLASAVDAPSAEVDAELVVVADASTYRAVVGDREAAVMHVVRTPDRVTLTSTAVDPAVRDRGIATALIVYVLDELRDAGVAIRVQCDRVARVVAQHPEYQALER